MVAAVILVLTAQGYLRGPYAGDIHVIAGLVILVREIAVLGGDISEFVHPAVAEALKTKRRAPAG